MARQAHADVFPATPSISGGSPDNGFFVDETGWKHPETGDFTAPACLGDPQDIEAASRSPAAPTYSGRPPLDTSGRPRRIPQNAPHLAEGAARQWFFPKKQGLPAHQPGHLRNLHVWASSRVEGQYRDLQRGPSLDARSTTRSAAGGSPDAGFLSTRQGLPSQSPGIVRNLLFRTTPRAQRLYRDLQWGPFRDSSGWPSCVLRNDLHFRTVARYWLL